MTQSVSVIVTAVTNMSPARLATLVDRLINLGLEDAEATVEDAGNYDDESVAEAKAALDVDLKVTPSARVLVHVSGGVASIEADPGVSVALYDFDSESAPVPAEFKDLADPNAIPVADVKGCGKCATCSCASK